MFGKQDRSDASVGWAWAGGGPQGVGGGGGGGGHQGGGAPEREVGGQAAAEGAPAPLLLPLLLHAGLGHGDARPPGRGGAPWGRGQAQAHRGLRVAAAGQEVGPKDINNFVLCTI